METVAWGGGVGGVDCEVLGRLTGCRRPGGADCGVLSRLMRGHRVGDPDCGLWLRKLTGVAAQGL